MNSQQLIGMGGLFYFAGDYFSTLKKECFDDETLHKYSKTYTKKLFNKWFNDLTPLITYLLEFPVLGNTKSKRIVYNGPVFKNLPMPKIPSRCDITPRPRRIALTDCINGLLHFCINLIEYNPGLIGLLAKNEILTNKLFAMLDKLHLNTVELTPLLLNLKNTTWKNEFLLGYKILIILKFSDPLNSNHKFTHYHIIYNCVLKLCETVPNGCSDIVSNILHNYLLEESLLQQLADHTVVELKKDKMLKTFLSKTEFWNTLDFGDLSKDLLKIYNRALDYQKDQEECLHIHKYLPVT
eukprot:UN33836